MRQLFAISLVLLSTVAFAQEIPAPPQAAEGQLFHFRDSEAARDTFVPMKGSQPVEWITTEQGGYVKLPLNFKNTNIERASWDIQIPLNLSLAGGIEFDFYCQALEAASQLNIYFHSGDGWYVMPFSLDHIGAWNHVALRKSAAFIEDKPEGWGNIREIRLSVWCNYDDADSVAAIANLRPLSQDMDTLVITAASCAQPGDPETPGYTQFAMQLSQSLTDLGLDSCTIADWDVDDSLLQKVKTAILPYNPVLPDGLLEKLETFVKGGGKLLVCYTVPNGLDKLLGVKRIGWEKSKLRSFAGMKATAEALPLQPNFAHQESPHTTVVEPDGPGRVIATWWNLDDTDSGLPAAVATPNGVFLGHVWCDPGGENVNLFLLSIMNYLNPEKERKSAIASEKTIGVVLTYAGLEDIRAKLPTDVTPEAEMALDKAFAVREKARDAIKGERWLESIKFTEAAKRQVFETLARQAKSVAGEQRGFWCHSAFGLPDSNWDESIKFLSENGFNTIFPNMLWGGIAFYKSGVLPIYPDYDKLGDQVRLCLDACRKYGVKCHVWKVNWNMAGHPDKAFVERMKAEKRTQVMKDGTFRDWLCPSNPLNRRLEADAMLELVRNYPELDGIHFDYIRYNDLDVCFCDHCRARFEERIGHAVAKWPDEVTKEPLWSEWLQFRRDNINALVKLVHDEAKAIRPSIQISAAVFANWKVDRDAVAQDWELWCRNKWLDFVCPMDYVDSPVALMGKIKRQIAWAHGVKLYPGIGLSCWKQPRDPLNLIEQIQAVRRYGLNGFTVFNFDNYAREVLPIVHLSCTKN